MHYENVVQRNILNYRGIILSHSISPFCHFHSVQFSVNQREDHQGGKTIDEDSPRIRATNPKIFNHQVDT